ncbi:MAG: PAS domain-containing sensor histidine kinase [Flammeovirgaceae bacterium]
MQEKLLLMIGNFDCTEKITPILSDAYKLEFIHDLPHTIIEDYAAILLSHNIQHTADQHLPKILSKNHPAIPIILIAQQVDPLQLITLFNDECIRHYLPWPHSAAQLHLAIGKFAQQAENIEVNHYAIDSTLAHRLSLSYSNSYLKGLSQPKLTEQEEIASTKYRQIVENLQGEYIFYAKDAHNQLTYISPSVYKILGFSKEEWHPGFFQHFTRSDLNKKALEFSLKTLEGKQMPAFKIEILDNRLRKRHFEISEVPIFNSTGELIGVEGIAHDITRQQEILSNIQRNLALQTALSEVSAAFNQTDDFEACITTVLPKIGTQAELQCIFLIKIKEDTSHQIASWQKHKQAHPDFPKLADHELQALKAHGHLILTSKDQQHSWLNQFGLTQGICYPLLYHQALIGYSFFGISGTESVREEIQGFLHTVAHIISQAFQRWKAHQELLDRVQNFRKLFEQAPFGIIAFIYSDKKVIINNAFAKILGYTREELTKKSAMELFHMLTHPEDKFKEQSLVDEVIHNQRKYYSIKKRYIHKDGSVVWVNLSGAFLRQEVDDIHMNIIMVQDITEKIKIEQEKEAEQEKLQQILDSLPISISLKNKSGQYLFFNQLGLNYTGKSLKDIIGKKAREIFPVQLASVYEAHDVQARQHQGEVEWFEVKKQTTEGEKEMLVGKKLVQSHNLGLDEELLLSFEVDITTLKKVELDLQRALNQLKQAQSNLEHSEKMSSLGILTAGVAHEINNPVNFIQGGIYILEDYLAPILELLAEYTHFENASSESEKEVIIQRIKAMKEVLEFDEAVGFLKDGIDSIQKGAERTVEIVRVLRNFSRSDDSLSPGVDLHEALDSTLVLLQNKLKDRIEVIKHYHPDLPSIACNIGQINQVFMNILSNAEQAIKHTGSITILTSIHAPNQVAISISDTGSGMSDAVMQRIFEPFYTTKKVGVGTGLGLSISHSIIDKHQGRIEVFSEENKGTEFKIYLPISHE